MAQHGFPRVSGSRHTHDLAIDNAVVLWRKLSEARGCEVVETPRYLTVNGTAEQGGLRVVVGREPPPSVEAAEINDRIRAAGGGPVAVEDHSATLDLRHVPDVAPSTMPVMARAGGTPETVSPHGVSVRTVRDIDDLRAVERIMVDGFPVGAFQPYAAGRMLPASLLADSAFTLLAARRDGDDAGSCLLLESPGVTGVYWVTTLPHHRSHGVGRALMLAALARVSHVPLILCATAAGEPLYRSLGFTTVGRSLWWR